MHWYNLCITPLCAGTQETTARGCWDCGEMAQHSRTSPSTPTSHNFCLSVPDNELPPSPFNSLPSFFAPRTCGGCLSLQERSSRQVAVLPLCKRCFIPVPQAYRHWTCRHLPAHWRSQRQSTQGTSCRLTFPTPSENSLFFQGNSHDCFGFYCK